MTLNLSLPQDPFDIRPKITVVGVGGAGGNAVNNMIRSKLEGVDFVVANTDAQALQQSQCERRIQLGSTVTQGLGAGARPDVGRMAAEEAVREIAEQLAGSHMVFITAGMGGGTGTGAGPGDRPDRPRAGHPDRRRGDQALPLRGLAPDEDGRSRHRRAAAATSTR